MHYRVLSVYRVFASFAPISSCVISRIVITQVLAHQAHLLRTLVDLVCYRRLCANFLYGKSSSNIEYCWKLRNFHNYINLLCTSYEKKDGISLRVVTRKDAKSDNFYKQKFTLRRDLVSRYRYNSLCKRCEEHRIMF